MVKKLADKNTKKLLSEAEIREKGLPKVNFSPSWQGRLHVLNKEKSLIAQKIGMEEEGEYAIKVK